MDRAGDCGRISPMIACPAIELSQGNFVWLARRRYL